MWIARLIAVGAFVCVAACGGGGGGDPYPSPITGGGIWTAQYVQGSGPNAGHSIEVKALVQEGGGEIFFAEIDTVTGCAVIGLGSGYVDPNSGSFSGSTKDAVLTFSQKPTVGTLCSFPDGSTSATSTLSGTVAQRSSLTLTDTRTTPGGMVLGAETHTWSYSSLYTETPNLAKLSGNYADGAGTLSVSLGEFFEQDPTTGCVITGSMGADATLSFNSYIFDFMFASCTGSAAVLNGQEATGIGYFDDSVSPNQLVFGVATFNGPRIVWAAALNRM